jgi:hypothetical protein
MRFQRRRELTVVQFIAREGLRSPTTSEELARCASEGLLRYPQLRRAADFKAFDIIVCFLNFHLGLRNWLGASEGLLGHPQLDCRDSRP